MNEPTETRLNVSSAKSRHDPRWTELIGPTRSGHTIEVSVPSAWIVEDEGGGERRRIAFHVKPAQYEYDLHSAGYNLGADGGADLYECIAYAHFRDAEDIHVIHVLRDNPPDLDDLVSLIDNAWGALTTRPDWESDEVEWVAEHIQHARHLLYSHVEITLTTSLEAPIGLSHAVLGRVDVP